jgi:UDP-2,3-diacylglucosamine hydrolase
MQEGKKIYFISDLHLGMHPEEESSEREKVAVRWLEMIEKDAEEVWLLGDIFDYWFEYKRVVPRGFTRFIGKLGMMSDKGIKIHLFTGNHDIWIFNYLPAEIGANLIRGHTVVKRGEKTLYLSHGDGLDKKDRGYLFLKHTFSNRFLQWCYARIHPNATVAFAKWWSKKSRYSKAFSVPFKGEEKEEQVSFAREHSKHHPEIDFFVFGHRHVLFDIPIEGGKRVICLGDWIRNYSYGVFDGKEFTLEKFF